MKARLNLPWRDNTPDIVDRIFELNDRLKNNLRQTGIVADIFSCHYLARAMYEEHDIEKAASRLCLMADRQGKKLSLSQAENLLSN